MEQKINFIYESWENKYLIWRLENWKIKNKKYYFQNLDILDIENNLKYFMQDDKFSYFQKFIAKKTDKKITIQEIEKEVLNIDLEWHIFIGYMISNIKVNWQEKNYILGEKWELEYVIWIYAINKLEYNNILKHFWKNTKIEIFPTSLFLLKEVTKSISNWNILYFWNENIEIVNIKNKFYYWVEKINIWKKIFLNKIYEIFNKYLTNTTDLSEFHKKVYEKELENYLMPIYLFIQKNLKWDNLYIIWDFKYMPLLLEKLSNHLKIQITPIKIDKKSFSTIEQANIYCIKKYF